MKKKIVALMLCAMLAAAAGCGAKNEENAVDGTEMVETTENGGAAETATAASSAFDIKGSAYVTLGDYSNVNVTINGDYEVNDETVASYFEQMFHSYGPFYKEDPEKTTIGAGDIVNVDYVGRLDGVAFEGGSAENQMIDVDKNASVNGGGYIEGFTDGLKGASVGDVIDCDVTFPEDYGNTDLAGKAVVFTFTVNSIQKPMTIEDVDDAFAKEQFQVETVDEMYAQIRTYMEQMADYGKQKDTYTAVQNYLLENSTVTVPDDYLAARLSDYKMQFIDTNCDGDESKLEEYVSTYYGKTAEEMEAEWKEGIDKSVRLELVMDAVAEELGITLDEERYATDVAQMLAAAGYGSEEAMYTIYGYGDAAYGERYFKDLYIYDLALEKVMETATVNVEAPAAE